MIPVPEPSDLKNALRLDLTRNGEYLRVEIEYRGASTGVIVSLAKLREGIPLVMPLGPATLRTDPVLDFKT